MNKVITTEVAERKKFLKTYGDEIPESFIPQLDLLPRKISCVHDEEALLPQVDQAGI